MSCSSLMKDTYHHLPSFLGLHSKRYISYTSALRLRTHFLSSHQKSSLRLMSSQTLLKDIDWSDESAGPDETWCPCLNCSTQVYRRRISRNTLLNHTGLRPRELKQLEQEGEIGLFRAYLAANPHAIETKVASMGHYTQFLRSHPNLTPLLDEIPSGVDTRLKRGRAQSTAPISGPSSGVAAGDTGAKRRRVGAGSEHESEVCPFPNS